MGFLTPAKSGSPAATAAVSPPPGCASESAAEEEGPFLMEIVVFGPLKRTGSLHGESVVDLSQLGREIVGPDGELIYPERCNKPTKPLPIYLARN